MWVWGLQLSEWFCARLPTKAPPCHAMQQEWVQYAHTLIFLSSCVYKCAYIYAASWAYYSSSPLLSSLSLHDIVGLAQRERGRLGSLWGPAFVLCIERERGRLGFSLFIWDMAIMISRHTLAFTFGILGNATINSHSFCCGMHLLGLVLQYQSGHDQYCL